MAKHYLENGDTCTKKEKNTMRAELRDKFGYCGFILYYLQKQAT